MTFAELKDLYELPFFELLKRARAVHEPTGKRRKSSSAPCSRSRPARAARTAATARKARATTPG
ncbi:MAG: hypothetical protein R3F11_29735 [Verrucomicrobiales bacterium]